MSTNRQAKRAARAAAKKQRASARRCLEWDRQEAARLRRPDTPSDGRLTLVPYTRFPQGDAP